MVTTALSRQVASVRFASPWFSRVNIAVFFALIAALAALVGPQRAQATTNPLAETVTTLVITDSTYHRVNQVNYGATISLSASVKTIQGMQVFKGTVVFCDGSVTTCLDGHSLGSAQIILQPPPNTVATITIVPKFGSHTYRAVFLGTSASANQPNQFYSSTSATSLFKVVGPPPPGTTTTTITSSGTPGNYTLSAKVVGFGGGTVKPTGNVNFLDASNGNAQLGSAPVGSTVLSSGFAGPQPLPQQPPFLYSLSAVADVNNDGYPDLLLLMPDYITPGLYDLVVMLNSKTGFAPPVQEAILPAGAVPLAMVTGDFNNDDKVDLAISTDDGRILILQGSGFGPFGVIATPIQTFFITTSMVVGDFNNSGNQSIVAVTPVGYNYLQGNGDYSFTQAGGNLGPNNDWDSAVAAGDVNGDGFQDLVMADPVTDKITVYFGNGQGLFGQTQSFSVGNDPAAMVMADFNGDGFLDVATANSGNNTVTILLGDGTGSFTTKATYSVGDTPMYMTSGDFTGDGFIDLAVGNFDAGTVTVLQGKGDGTFKKSTLTGDCSVGVFAADFNADGYSDVAAIGATAPSIFLSSWMSTSTAKLTSVAVAGIGTHQASASYVGDTTYQGSSSGTVPLTATPLATTLQLSASPDPGVWGQQVALNATLSPYTAQGHSTDGEVVTFYNGTLSLGTAHLSLGVATLNIPQLSMGAHNLKASYGGDADFGASVSWLTFTMGKAASSTVLTAASYSPKVGVADLLTAMVTGYSSPRGNVVFTQDGNTICTVPLGSTGKATCSYIPWGTSASSLVASYQGDGKYAGSDSAPLSLTATPAAFSSKIVLSFDTTQLTYPGATNSKTCITRSTSATPTGTVNILDGPANLQTLTVGGDGCAYWYINPGLNAGTHPMRAWYSGDSNNPSGYSKITNVTVNQATTSWSHACWNQSFQFGQNYQCNVSAWSNSGSPGGNILYSYDGGPSQAAPLSAGNTSFVISLPAVGNHTVTLWYPGAANYTATSPQTESFTVTQ